MQCSSKAGRKSNTAALEEEIDSLLIKGAIMNSPPGRGTEGVFGTLKLTAQYLCVLTHTYEFMLLVTLYLRQMLRKKNKPKKKDLFSPKVCN